MHFQTITSASAEQLQASLDSLSGVNNDKAYITSLEADHSGYLVANLKIADDEETFIISSIVMQAVTMKNISNYVNGLNDADDGFTYIIIRTVSLGGYIIACIQRAPTNTEAVSNLQWKGQLTQEGTNAPTVVITIDQLPEDDVTFTYLSPGRFKMISASGAFTERTDIRLNRPFNGDSLDNSVYNWDAILEGSQTINILVDKFDGTNFVPVNGYLNGTFLSLIIYPETGL